MSELVKWIDNGEYDIVGDIHGEIDAITNLIYHLGYDKDGNHPSNRKLIFVGDLVDRGPDSIAVLKLVSNMVNLNNAHCILGNHELNILLSHRREGNGWFFGLAEHDFKSTIAHDDDRLWVLEFLNRLPIAIHSESIRVAHACWDNSDIDALSTIKNSIQSEYDQYEASLKEHSKSSGIYSAFKKQSREYFHQLTDRDCSVPYLEHIAAHNMLDKEFNKFKSITSGPEYKVDTPFFAGGRWRMLDRKDWWNSYTDDTPVVIGHYWRTMNYQPGSLFTNIDPLSWFGAKNNVFCIDYSVGRRFLDRKNRRPYHHKLHALRFPDNTLMSEDGDVITILNKWN